MGSLICRQRWEFGSTVDVSKLLKLAVGPRGSILILFPCGKQVRWSHIESVFKARPQQIEIGRSSPLLEDAADFQVTHYIIFQAGHSVQASYCSVGLFEHPQFHPLVCQISHSCSLSKRAQRGCVNAIKSSCSDTSNFHSGLWTG